MLRADNAIWRLTKVWRPAHPRRPGPDGCLTPTQAGTSVFAVSPRLRPARPANPSASASWCNRFIAANSQGSLRPTSARIASRWPLRSVQFPMVTVWALQSVPGRARRCPGSGRLVGLGLVDVTRGTAWVFQEARFPTACHFQPCGRQKRVGVWQNGRSRFCCPAADCPNYN